MGLVLFSEIWWKNGINGYQAGNSLQIKDHVYRMVIVEVQQYLTKPNHCIWPIRTHYTLVSTNEQFAPKWRRPGQGTAAFNYYHPIYMILAANASTECVTKCYLGVGLELHCILEDAGVVASIIILKYIFFNVK